MYTEHFSQSSSVSSVRKCVNQNSNRFKTSSAEILYVCQKLAVLINHSNFGLGQISLIFKIYLEQAFDSQMVLTNGFSNGPYNTNL